MTSRFIMTSSKTSIHRLGSQKNYFVAHFLCICLFVTVRHCCTTWPFHNNKIFQYCTVFKNFLQMYSRISRKNVGRLLHCVHDVFNRKCTCNSCATVVEYTFSSFTNLQHSNIEQQFVCIKYSVVV